MTPEFDDALEDGADTSRFSEAGDTLVEVLIALVVLSISAVALMLSFATSISASAEHRSLTTFDTVLRSAAEEVTTQVQQLGSTYFANCEQAGQVSFSGLPTGYSASITSVQYWNASSDAFNPAVTTFSNSSCLANEVANAPVLFNISVTHNGASQTIQTVVDDPLARSVPSYGSAYQLAFLASPGNEIAGTTLFPPPEVAVVDSSGNIVTTDLSPISLAITSGTGTSGATLSSTCTGTVFYGVVTFTNCGISTAGTGYKLTATDPSESGVSSATTATAFNVTAGPPAQLLFTQEPGNGTGGSPFSTQPSVTLEDSSGNPVTGNTSQVSLTITSGTGSSGATLTCAPVTPGSTTGVATFSGCNINQAGTNYTLSASDGTLVPSVSTTLNVTVGPPALLAFTTQPVSGTAGVAPSTQPAVTVEDLGGNTVTANTSAVTLAIGTNPNSGTLSCGSNPLNAVSGIASFSGCSVNKAGGGYTLVATDGSLTSATSNSFSISAGAASQFAFTSSPVTGAAALSDVIGPITVSEEDAYGNPTTTAEVVNLTSSSSGTHVFSLTSGGSGVSSVTIPSGSTSTTFYYGDTKAGTPTITATGALTSATQVETITPGAGVSLAITSTAFSASANSSATTAFTTTLEDTFGNPTTSSSAVTVSLSSSAGTGKFASTSGGGSVGSVTLPANTQSVTAYYGQTATGTPTLTAAGSGLGSGTQNETIVAATASQLVVTSQPPSSSTAAVSFTTLVSIEDVYGNVVTSSSASVGMAFGNDPTGGTLSCVPNPVVAYNGVATLSCSVNKVGTGYTLTASSSGLSSVTTNAFNITVGAPAKFVFTSTAVSGTASSSATLGPITVQEQDAGGNPTTTAETVNLGSSYGGAVFAATSGGSSIGSVSIPGGSSSVNFYYGDTVSGSPTITGSGSLTSATQVETINPGTGTKLAFTSTAFSDTASGSPTDAFTVTLEDTYGNAATSGSATTVNLSSGSSGTKEFAATSGGSTVTSVTLPANTASVTAYYGDTHAGTPTLTAAATGLTSGTQVETITAGTGSKLSFTSSAFSAAAGTSPTTAFTVTLQDVYGNTTTSGSAITVNLSSGSSGTKEFAATSGGSTVASVTLPANTASVTAYYGDTQAGAPILTAAATGLTSGTQSETITAGTGTKLAFSSAAFSAHVGSTPTTAFTVTLEDSYGNATTSGSAITVNLSSNSSGTKEFSATSGGTTVTSVSLPANTSSVTAYYGDTHVGTPTLTAAATGLTSGTQVETMTGGTPAKLVITSSAFTATQSGSATSAFTVTLEDSSGNATTSSSAITVNLSSNSTFAEFAASSGGSSVSSVTLPANTQTVTAYYGQSLFIPSNPTITVAATGLTSGTQTETINL